MDATAIQRAASAAGSPGRRDVEPNATLVARIDLTSTIARFTIRPDGGPLPFEPGQYFALGLTLAGRLVQRPYSTASAPGSARDLEFLVRLVEGGTFTPRLWALPVGARLRVGPAKGLFTLRRRDPRTHLFIATGTGLAPFLSMLAALAADEAAWPGTNPTSPRAVVVHGVSHVAELAYRDRLERMAAGPTRVRYSPVVSRPTHPDNAGWTGLTGRLDAHIDELCDVHRLVPAESVAYLCGNPGVIATAERILTAHGLAREAIVSEQYWPPEEHTPAG